MTTVEREDEPVDKEPVDHKEAIRDPEESTTRPLHKHKDQQEEHHKGHHKHQRDPDQAPTQHKEEMRDPNEQPGLENHHFDPPIPPTQVSAPEELETSDYIPMTAELDAILQHMEDAPSSVLAAAASQPPISYVKTI